MFALAGRGNPLLDPQLQLFIDAWQALNQEVLLLVSENKSTLDSATRAFALTGEGRDSLGSAECFLHDFSGRRRGFILNELCLFGERVF